jgi:lysophospholipase L1-like esterase
VSLKILDIAKNAIILALVALVCFLYGLAVGHYQFVPFDGIRVLKQRFDPEIALLKRWERHLPGWMRRQSREMPEVAMLGGSITAQGDWTRMFPQTNVANLGVGGDTAAAVLHRLDEVLGLKPGRVFLMIGVNDLQRNFPVALVQAQIEVIVERLLESGITPIVQSTLYTSDEAMNRRITALNAKTRAWCAAKAVAYVDLNELLSADGAIRPSLTEDGVHLNAEGYRLWGETIRRLVVQVRAANG